MFRRRREWYNEVVVYKKRTNTQGNAKYGINYDIDELIAANSMFDRINFTKVLQTEEEEEVDVVEGNGKERLVLSGIVIYWENVKCVQCLMIFR